MKKLTNYAVLIIGAALLLVTFIYGLSLSYEMGFATGGNLACNDLSFGVTLEGDYLCFNESYNIPLEDYGFNSEIAYEVLE